MEVELFSKSQTCPPIKFREDIRHMSQCIYQVQPWSQHLIYVGGGSVSLDIYHRGVKTEGTGHRQNIRS